MARRPQSAHGVRSLSGSFNVRRRVESAGWQQRLPDLTSPGTAGKSSGREELKRRKARKGLSVRILEDAAGKAWPSR
jgi:hypothetical protein